ncbi:MAG: hypothetical protein LBH09_01400 [Peptococcaceae bacterium]|jgi:hypothetical protein|nr:hypothetical protein [Peptococcaceae bacterium]
MNEQEIIALQKRVMQEQFSSIHSTMTMVNGKRYHFIEQEIPNADMLLFLPREFIDLPPDIARQKYPAEDRPQCIKSSRDISINFAFKILPAKAREEDLTPMRNGVLDALRRVYPQNTYLETGVGSLSHCTGQIYCWFDYYGPTLDAESYSFNAILRHDQKPVYFVFNCPKEGYESWRLVVFEVLDTIRSKPLGWKGEEKK